VAPPSKENGPVDNAVISAYKGHHWRVVDKWWHDDTLRLTRHARIKALAMSNAKI
jgi:hypothetical protein